MFSKLFRWLFGRQQPNYEKIESTPRDKSLPLYNLHDKKIAIVIGHEPGGQARSEYLDEREYNTRLAHELEHILKRAGANVIVYNHRYKPYSKRQADTAQRIKKLQGMVHIAAELHCDAYSDPFVQGHHYKFRGYRKLAEAFSSQTLELKPDSNPRFSGGIHRAMTGDGAGFLRAMPGPAVLCEPFFLTNQTEVEFFQDNIEGLAMAYAKAMNEFLS